jgi:hypothetical protein
MLIWFSSHTSSVQLNFSTSFHAIHIYALLLPVVAANTTKNSNRFTQNNHSKKTFKQSIQETSNLNINEQLHYNIAHDNHTK